MRQFEFKAATGLLILAVVLNGPVAIAASCSLILRADGKKEAYPGDPQYGPFLLVENAGGDLLVRNCRSRIQDCPVIARIVGSDVPTLEKALHRAEMSILASETLLLMLPLTKAWTKIEGRLTTALTNRAIRGVATTVVTTIASQISTAASNRALGGIHRKLDTRTYARARSTLDQWVYVSDVCASDFPYLEKTVDKPIPQLAREIREAVELGVSVRNNQVAAWRPIKSLSERWSSLHPNGPPAGGAR
jgi:hypothetical protein